MYFCILIRILDQTAIYFLLIFLSLSHVLLFCRWSGAKEGVLYHVEFTETELTNSCISIIFSEEIYFSPIKKKCGVILPPAGNDELILEHFRKNERSTCKSLTLSNYLFSRNANNTDTRLN